MSIDQDVRIIRTSSRYWIEDIGGILLFLVVFPLAGIFYWGERFYFVGGFALVVGIPSLIKGVIAAYNNKISFAKSGMVVQLGREAFKAKWESVKAIRFSGKGTSRRITLFSETQDLNIPCNYFDEKKVVNELNGHLPPEVLDPQAYHSLPQVVEWRNNTTRKLENISDPLRVSLGIRERWIGILSICVGAAIALYSYFSSNNATDIIGGISFGGLGVLLVISCLGWIEGTYESITVRTLFRRHELSWKMLNKIFIDSNRGIVALVSDDCRLILPSPSTWSGKDKELLYELTSLKINASKIEPTENSAIVFWRSKTLN